MAFANASISDILATTIESRTRKIADNVTNNNALLMKLKKQGRIKTFSGGHKILQELSFAENSNAGWYSGYDLLPVGVSDVISAAEYDIKQAAVPVVISGLEQLQNSGREKMIDLMEGLTNKTQYIVKTGFPSRELFVTEQSQKPGWGRYLSGRMRLLRQRAIVDRER